MNVRTRLLTIGTLSTMLLAVVPQCLPADPLAEGWQDPPRDARIRAYWWWLNGSVTKAAITRDLEEMKTKGFGGALICDADGSSQDGNDRAPHGPTFFTPEWRELYKHTLREADRLGLEMSLNIQSGWNLGGPMVTADDAAKKLVWSETRATGPAKFANKLPEPASRDGYYRDAVVVAYQLKASDESRNLLTSVKALSEQSGHPATLLADGNPNTFWVSTGTDTGAGPTRQRPQWVQFEFATPVSVNQLLLQPRPAYGPRECELQVADDSKSFRPVKVFTAAEKSDTTVSFEAVTGRTFLLVIYSSFDPRFPQSPRNAQIAELRLSGKDGTWPSGAGGPRRPIQNWEQKAGHKPLHFSAPDTSLLFQDVPAEPGEEDARAADVIDLTDKLDKDGTLHWDMPAGAWQILRFGYTIGNRSYVSTSSEGWKGFALDVLDAGAFQRYWDAVVEPLIADAGPLAGKTLKYLHTDSWEVEPLNWTPRMREEFRKRRGYDLLPFLPVMAGRIVDSRAASNRFLHDFQKTLGDLAIDNHYRPFRDGAHKHGLQIHPESGGPHAVPIDAQRCLGFNDVPMSEFWARSWRHRIGDENRFFVKQPASAAHTYGHKLVAAEGFTTIGPHWQETIWDNLKPSFDKACCEGLNLLVWHAFVCSPAEMGLPGIQYFAGTHLNPNTTWWSRSAPFFAYLNRCQFMLQQGLFAADVAYYYGDHVPNFAQLKRSDPAHVLPGYDYDVVTEEVVLTRMAVKDSRIVLPDGMSYRVLVLRDQTSISLPVLRKLKELVSAGAIVVGPKPTETTSLRGYPQCDAEVQQIARELWDAGKITQRPAKEAMGVPPDVEGISDWIHRRGSGMGFQPMSGKDLGQDAQATTDLYFVSNQQPEPFAGKCTFRVVGKQPEFWDPVTGERREAGEFTQDAGRTTLPLELPAYGSMFVVFRSLVGTAVPSRPQADGAPGQRARPVLELGGPWQVNFDPKWGGPASVQFAELVDWTKRAEDGIKHYAGTATYRKTFDAPKTTGRLWLDLGNVSMLGEVRLNGKNLGIVWAPPFRVEITGFLKPAGNVLEVDVVSSWFNRMIKDQTLPVEQRLTQTNIRVKPNSQPVPAGLLGPVQILTADSQPK